MDWSGLGKDVCQIILSYMPPELKCDTCSTYIRDLNTYYSVSERLHYLSVRYDFCSKFCLMMHNEGGRLWLRARHRNYSPAFV